MNRRRMLALMGSSLGAAAGAGLLGRYALLPPARSATLDPVKSLAARLYESLDGETRSRVCVDYDHPLRQYHNRGVRGGGMGIGSWSFTREQRSWLTDLLHAGLSEQGRERVPNEYFLRWGGVHLMNVLICGDPRTPSWQMILSGPHLNLRLGGRSREGVAFGGPMVYGDQRGDSRQGIPGNLFRFQFETAHRLFISLRPEERRTALLAEAPIQTRIELQGARGSFAGVPVGALTPESRRLARDLFDGILSTYPAEDVAYAGECLERNGGIDALHASWYEDGEVDRSGQYQIFRLEGPAAVLHFRGFPHVHAFVNIGMDGDHPLSVGEPLGENPAVIEGGGVKRLFERAMKERTGADFAYYARESVVGRLRSGPIRSGDIYTLESWQNGVTLVEIKGSSLRGNLLDQIRAGGDSPVADRVYTVAASGYEEDRPAWQTLGRIESRREMPMLREMVVAHLRARGFGDSA